jgi:Domain of unknown function (DUF5069)
VPTDFRNGKTFPRRGRLPLGRFLWLARVIDKGRASANGTIHDYIYPCPMDKGMMERWGITPEEFTQAIAQHKSDDAMLRWVQSKVSDAKADAANSWLSTEKFTSLNRQDREENAFD